MNIQYSILNIHVSSHPHLLRVRSESDWGSGETQFRERVAGVRVFRVCGGHTLIGEPVRGNGSDPRRIPGAHPLSHESRPDDGALGQGIVLKDAPAPSPGSLARELL